MGLKILSLPVDLSACGQYRIRKPLEGLNLYTEADCHVVDYQKDNMVEIIKAFSVADVIFMRPGAEVGMAKIKAIPELSKMKAKWVMDIDDNVDEISPYSDFYRSYGTKNYQHDDLDVWKDGDKGFFITNNLERLSSLKMGMRSCDLITVTTNKLKEHALKYNSNAYVNDNTLDMNHWYRLTKQDNNQLRVVWQGSPSHYEDWYAIKEPLNKLMDEYDFEIIMLGSQYQGIFDGKHKKRVKCLPWIPFEAHSYRMMSLQADIGIIPLADLPFNQYKSAIKHYENMAIGLPSVVSLVGPYKDSLNKNTGLGYSNSGEFYSQMKRLICDRSLRSKIADEGEKWVKDNKSLELESKKLYNRLEELVYGHKN